MPKKVSLQRFISQEFGEIRGININNIPYLVGNDVAEKLGYQRPTKAIQDDVDADDKILLNSKTQSLIRTEFDYHQLGQRGGWLINESGFYSLVFGSKLSRAKEFKHWVTSEVLPQIRQTGGYVVENRESEFIDNYFPSFTDDTKLAMVQDLLKTNKKYKSKIQKLQPQATAYKDLMTAQGYIKFIDLAQSVEIGRTKLFDFLRKKKVLTKQSNFNVPYGKFTKNGYFRLTCLTSSKRL